MNDEEHPEVRQQTVSLLRDSSAPMTPLQDTGEEVTPTSCEQELDAQSCQGSESCPQERLLRQLIEMVAEVRDLLMQEQIRDYYSLDEVAKIMGRAVWTVREWCRLGRVHAEKKKNGRGRSHEWVISHPELQRIRKEGLLPLRKN